MVLLLYKDGDFRALSNIIIVLYNHAPMKAISPKFREWWKRYWFAEVLSLFGGVLMASAVLHVSNNGIIAAFTSTWTQNIIFYGTIVWKDFASHRQGSSSTINFLRTFRNMILEFGPAEYLDSFVIRPLYLVLLPSFISNYALAIALGTILADITFYIPVTSSYELRKKYLRE